MNRNKQKGFTILQLSAGLVIVGITTASIVEMRSRATDQADFERLGNMLAKHSEAVSMWIIDQGGAAVPATRTDLNWLKDRTACGLPSGGTVAYLPCGFNFTNIRWGETPTSVITNTGGITTVTSSWPSIRKGAEIMSVGAGQAVAKAESVNMVDLRGFVTYTDDNNAVITAAVDVNNGTSVYVRRSGDTMTGDLGMGGNNISGVGVLTATTGAFQDVNASANISAGGDISASGRVSGTEFRDQNDPSFVLDPSGNSRINSVTATGDATVNGQFRARQFTDLDDPTFVNDPSGMSRFRDLNLTGNAQVAGSADINALTGNLQVTALATEGAPCSGNGRLAVTSVGKLLTCQSSIWTAAQGGEGTGLSGIIRPLRGMEIRCRMRVESSYYEAKARVDANAIMWVAMDWYSSRWRRVIRTSGWQRGTTYSVPHSPYYSSEGYSLQGGVSGLTASVIIYSARGPSYYRGACNASWPET